MRKYIAEMFGTFTLCFSVLLSVSGQSTIPTPLLAALCLTLFVYTIGNISGAHINPAVTIGLLSLKKIKLDEAIKYIMFQFFGAVLALSFLNLLQITEPRPMPTGGYPEFFAETIGMAVFTFGIASVVFGNAPGFVVGGSLLLGISISALIGSAGILNPAVALVLTAFQPAYILGEVIGSILGFGFYNYLSKPTAFKKKSN